MKKGKLFIVALHVSGMEQAGKEAAGILADGGAHGVVLVNNGFRVRSDSNPSLFDIAREIRKHHPLSLIGVNPLDLDAKDAIARMPGSLDMLWTDEGGIVEHAGNANLRPDLVRPLAKFRAQYWGSELFKVGELPANPEAVAKAAAENFSALITSGPATGKAPEVSKIKQIREWVGPYAKLGIASGMNADNVHLFLDYADIFIVATSLCVGDGKGSNFWYYDREKVKAFRSAIDEYTSKK